MNQPKQTVAPQVAVPASVEELHPVVLAWLDENSTKGAPRELPEPGPDRRMLFILSALLTALESRGHVLQRPPGYLYPMRCEIAGVPVDMALHELQAWRETRAARSKRKKGLPSDQGEWVSTGRLRLTAEGDHKKRRWEDGRRPLELQLGRAILSLERLAAAHIEAKRRGEESERAYERAKERRARRIRHREHQAECWSELRDAAANLEEARLLRRFISEVVRRARAMPEPPANLTSWLTWARTRVKELDPLSDGPGAFLEFFADVGKPLIEEPLSEEDELNDRYVKEDAQLGFFD